MKTIDQLETFEYIKDEYGNFYEIMGIETKLGKLTEIILSHAYYEVSFQRLMDLEDNEKEKYGQKHIGVFLQDIINSNIQRNLKEHGKIYSIKELKDANVNVLFLNITERHPAITPLKR